MRRVVITGLGIVSSIGNDAEAVAASLKAGRSGISFAPDYAEHGFRCQVHGTPADRRRREQSTSASSASWATAPPSPSSPCSRRSPTPASRRATSPTRAPASSPAPAAPRRKNLFEAHQTVIEKGSPKRMGPFMVTRCMSSTVSACLATPFRIKGINYSITSACSTSAHCIGAGVEQIQWGKQDIVFAGGGEELDWTLSCLFDAMGAMSTKYNNEPDPRLARLRRRPRRLRHRRRRRHGGARGARARPRPRREDLRRGHRLRRHLRRPRHGRPLRRRRRARHAPRAGDAARKAAASATSTPTAPRPRSATSARSRRSAASSARARRRRSARRSR